MWLWTFKALPLCRIYNLSAKNEDFLWTQKTLGLFYFHEWQISWLNKIWQILNSKLMTWFTHSWESNNKNIFLNLSSIPSNFIIEPNLSYNIKFTQCVFVNKKIVRQRKTKVYKSKLREVKQFFFSFLSETKFSWDKHEQFLSKSVKRIALIRLSLFAE